MPFIVNTDRDRADMLTEIGVQGFEDLLVPIPKSVRLNRELDIKGGLSEVEVTRSLAKISGLNETINEFVSFLGGGAYDHFIPAAVRAVTSRPEFYTAYTPYQAEVSQGTLQAIYEYQSLICRLMGMDAANASLYDGATALAEAAFLAYHHTGRRKVVISKGIHPHYRSVLRTSLQGLGLSLVEVDLKEGATDEDRLGETVDDQTAAVLVQHPNFLGCLEEVEELEKVVHRSGALYVVSVDPISLGLLKPPGDYGADVVTAEGQGLGNSLSYGGPYLGIFAVKESLIRRLPGRIVGATQDREGKPGFVMTLQTREQHIRRGRATSNICSNQALNALAAAVYLSLMGKEGIRGVAQLCLQKSHYLAEEIAQLKGFKLRIPRPFFKEFVLQVPLSPGDLIRQLRGKEIFAGIDLGRFDYGLNDCLLVAVTEKRTKDEMDRFVKALRNSYG